MSDVELEQGIAAAIGADRLVGASSWGAAFDEDVCRAPLGTPRAWVRPRSSEEVAALIRLARSEQIPVVAAGQRTAYWRPLRFEGAIVLETKGLDRIEPFDAGNRRLWCGAGVSVRDLDDALRANGHVLAAHPDAFGGTSIGSMVATGFTSGIGMGLADADTLIAGLELVLGTGAIVRTGAAASLGAPPFLRTGLPDPTGLMLAAEGSLGIVTRVAVRALARAHRCMLSFRVDCPLAAMLPLAEALRVPGLYETFRVVDRDWLNRAPLEVDIVVRSPINAAEIDARVTWVCEHVARLVPHATGLVKRRERPDETILPRFWGEADEAWSRMREGRFVPIDINSSYTTVAAAIARSDTLLAEHRELPWIDRRRALYFAPDFVNFGLHGSLDPSRSEDATALAFVLAGTRALAEQALVPYRFGRVWASALGERLDPGYHALMHELRRVCDPDGLLNPGVSVFGLEP